MENTGALAYNESMNSFYLVSIISALLSTLLFCFLLNRRIGKWLYGALYFPLVPLFIILSAYSFDSAWFSFIDLELQKKLFIILFSFITSLLALLFKPDARDAMLSDEVQDTSDRIIALHIILKKPNLGEEDIQYIQNSRLKDGEKKRAIKKIREKMAQRSRARTPGRL